MAFSAMANGLARVAGAAGALVPGISANVGVNSTIRPRSVSKAVQSPSNFALPSVSHALVRIAAAPKLREPQLSNGSLH